MPSSVTVPTRVVERFPSFERSALTVTVGASLTTSGTSRPESKTWISEIAVQYDGVFVNASRTRSAVTVSNRASLNFGPGTFGALNASGTVVQPPEPSGTWIEYRSGSRYPPACRSLTNQTLTLSNVVGS